MRNLLTVYGGLVLVAAAAGCEAGPGAAAEPPVLKVTSPVRGLIQDHAGQVTVTGTVAPNAKGDPVDGVLVNAVPATVGADGTFRATIDVAEGATMIQTIARDRNGTTASDTRAVEAGQLRAVGANIPSAVTAAMSADAFAKLSAAAGPIVKAIDLAAMLAPMQPMVNVGSGCDFGQIFVDNVTFSDIKIAMAPVQGGLSLRVEIDDLAVPAHLRYRLACLPTGSSNLGISATKVVVAGTLNVTPNGMAGFTTKLASPDVSLTGFQMLGIPSGVLAFLDVDAAISFIVTKGAELAMNPLMNQALGALAGPQQLDVLGTKLAMQVAPSAITFDPTGAVIAMNMQAMLAGSEASPGFIYTSNGTPTMDPSVGFQLGLADDLANELMAELQALGTLDLTMPVQGGTFDAAQLHMTMPPMISADATDGRMRVVLGDVLATFTRQGTPVGKAAINARIDLKIAPIASGYTVALQLGTPEIHVDTLDDIANTTGVDDQDLATATGIVLGAQIDSISKLLLAIPVPAIAGIQIRNLAIGADHGYVMVSGQLE